MFAGFRCCRYPIFCQSPSRQHARPTEAFSRHARGPILLPCVCAYAGLKVDDPKPDSDVLQSVSSDVCTDVVFSSLPKTPGRKEQGGCVGSEALSAELIPAIEFATEPDETAEVAV